MQAIIIVIFASTLGHCKLVEIRLVGFAGIIVPTEPTLRYLLKPLQRKVSPFCLQSKIKKSCIEGLLPMKPHELYLLNREDKQFKKNPKGPKNRSTSNNSTARAFVRENTMGRCAFTCTRDRYLHVTSDLTESLDSSDVLMMAQIPALQLVQ